MKQLTWSEMTDFTGGLYTVADFLIPTNGSKQMLDCHSIATGGIRAFFKPTALTTAGIGAGEEPVCMFTRAIGQQSGTGESPDSYVLTRVLATNHSNLYRLDEAQTVPATSWSLIATLNGRANFATIVPYTLASGEIRLYLMHNSFLSPDAGIWSITQQAGVAPTIAKIATHIGFLTVHQSRLVTGTVEASARIRWTDVASETFPADNYLDIEPARDSNSWAYTFAPQDLLVAKQGSYYYMVQGDISAPLVRQESGVNAPGRIFVPAETEHGLAVFSQNQGLWFTPNGISWQHASPQLEPDDVTVRIPGEGFGAPQYFGGYLFLPSGLVWHRDTQSWFRLSEWSAAAPAGGITIERNRDNWGLSAIRADRSAAWRYYPSDQVSQRKSSYTWQSAPLRAPSGRQLVVREVQLVMNVFGAGASCAMTVGGTTRTATGIGAGKQKVSFLFNEYAEVLDLTVVPNSNNASLEAPIIETVRIGSLAGHQTV